MKTHPVAREIAWLCHQGLDWVTLSTQASVLLRKVVPYESVCWHTTDPATMLLTGSVRENLPDDGLPILTRCEYEIQDYIRWSFLARRRQAVGILGEATNGRLEQSTRYRELLRPNGIEWELRASLVAGAACWGVVGLYRGPGEPDFDHEEAAIVGAVSPTLAEGFRRALLVAAVPTDETPDGPGLVVLDPHDSIESLTPPAHRWLEELAEVAAPADALPAAVHAVAARARAAGNRELSAVQTRARAYTRSGRWLVLHATKLNGTAGGRIAVIVEPARATEIAPLVVDAYGLSERERQVMQLVLQGLATSEIARTLFISPHTVQQHLKTIFDKIGVHSRRDLVARVFSDHYRPNLLREDTPALGPSGWFAEKPPPTARGR